jgi:hypothetical protein
MPRFMFVLCATVAASLIHVSTASACANDSFTFRVEQEFKTSYERKTNHEFKSNYHDQNPSPSPRLDYKGPVASLAGIGLLLGAFGIVTVSLRGRRS